MAVAHRDGVIAVSVQRGAAGGGGAGLDAVGRDIVQEVEAGADGAAVAGVIVQLAEIQFLMESSRNRAEEARQQRIDGAALCGRSRGSGAAGYAAADPPRPPLTDSWSGLSMFRRRPRPRCLSAIGVRSRSDRRGSRPCRPSCRCVSVIRGEASDSLREGGQIKACQVLHDVSSDASQGVRVGLFQAAQPGLG